MVRRKKKKQQDNFPTALPPRPARPRALLAVLLVCLSGGCKAEREVEENMSKGNTRGKKKCTLVVFFLFLFFFPSFISCLAVLSVLAVIWGLGLYRVCVFFPFWKTIIRCLFVFLRSCLFPFETQRTGLTGRRGEGGWLGKGWGFRVVAPTGALFPPFSFLFFTAYFYLFFPFFLSL